MTLEEFKGLATKLEDIGVERADHITGHLEDWIDGYTERVITEAQAVIVEQCASVLETRIKKLVAENPDQDSDEGVAARAQCFHLMECENAIRSLSSDPGFLDRERMRAWLAGHDAAEHLMNGGDHEEYCYKDNPCRKRKKMQHLLDEFKRQMDEKGAKDVAD